MRVVARLLYSAAITTTKEKIMIEVKYPEVEVQLTGEDGNAFAVLGRVMRALRRADVDDAEIKAFQDEATSGDYNHLLQTCMRWVEVS